ncbi:MAG: AAA family ATPase, partial [Planctomycetes bacterium]|nr:AAA family ATPase [Planctomycetota bacterium]
MPSNELKWTTAQKLAIETIDSDVLVTASAGTGKTAVLAQRCVRILADQQDPTDVSQILVLTFTEASAEEMKQRIAAQLADEIEKKSCPYLRRQLLMLDAAHISTIDAFCKKIITENFHLLTIDPTFRIIDPDEQKLIRSEVLSEVIEQAFNDPQLCPAIMNLLENRGVTTPDKGFLTSILAVSGFLQTHLSPKNWFNLAATLTDITNVYTSNLAKRQRDMILKKLLQCESMLKYAIRLDELLTEDNFFTDHLNSEYLSPIQNAIDSINSGTDEYIKKITAFKPTNFKRKPKDLCAEDADMIKAPAKNVKNIISKLADLAIINPKYEQVVTPLANLQTKTMLELVRRFNRQYAKIKQQTNCLDFADLEHNMIKLLETSPKTAELLRKQFRYIFVDEYQDTNNLQQGILEKISRPNNVFVVGDIKQSIYAFRQAKPEIFLNRLNQAGKTSALRVDLATNFRSRSEVLDFANTIFERIMTAEVASIDYDEKAILRSGFEYDNPKMKTPFVELNLIDEEADTEPDNEVTLRQRQAVLIGEKIRSIIGKFNVYDKQTKNYRPVEYRDIVILMRAPSATIADYIDILRLAAIPVQSKNNAGYFEATEIIDIISTLKILDNPQRDIELASVLRSPIFNTTDTELAQIRNHTETANPDTTPSFYDCLLSYANSGPDETLREKLNR